MAVSKRINLGGGAISNYEAGSGYVNNNLTAYDYGAYAYDLSGLNSPAPNDVYRSSLYTDTNGGTKTITGLTPGASYTVRFHLVENTAGINYRISRYLLNGVVVLDNFSTFNTAGGDHKPIIREFSATATGAGEIVFGMQMVSGDLAHCAGIELLAPDFSITTASPLPQATVGQAYGQTIQTANGVTPLNSYAPAITIGMLPSGLAIGFAASNNATDSALISGTPTTAGTSVFTVRLRDSSFTTRTKEFSITVNAAVAITSSSGALDGGTVGLAYSGTTPTKSGGTPAYVWSILLGNLPNGLSLNAEGKPVGTPTTAGTFAFTRRVTDANGSFAEQSHTIAVVAPASPPPTASFTKSASSGNAPLAVNFSDTSTGTPTAWSWNFGDGNTSTAQNPLHTFGAPGTYTVTLSASNSYGSTQTTQTIIVTEAAALPLGFNRAGLELLVIPNEMTPTNGTSAGSLTDYTDYVRHLTAASGYPTFQTGVQNSKAIVRFSGSNNPLKNAATFSVACGWMVVKHTGVTFGDFEGVLSGLASVGILVGGGAGATTFFDFLDDYYEYRLNDRISPKENAPAPMGVFKLIFFRFWRPIMVDGIQIGQDRTFTTRKFTGDIGLLALSSRNFCEKEIRAQSQRIVDYSALTLADVIPYQGMKRDEVISGRAANVYDPPEGNRIVEVIGNYNQSFNLTFENRSNSEFKAMRDYHKGHYPIPETAYRDYNVLPPEDVDGYIDSPLRKSGATNNISYSFSFKGK